VTTMCASECLITRDAASLASTDHDDGMALRPQSWSRSPDGAWVGVHCIRRRGRDFGFDGEAVVQSDSPFTECELILMCNYGGAEKTVLFLNGDHAITRSLAAAAGRSILPGERFWVSDPKFRRSPTDLFNLFIGEVAHYLRFGTRREAVNPDALNTAVRPYLVAAGGEQSLPDLTWTRLSYGTFVVTTGTKDHPARE
jgi:hypothetical protein